MAANDNENVVLSQLWPNVVSILILALLSTTLLVLSPWGIDVLYSGITHFLMLWPLLLLAVITFIAWAKLAESETEIPSR